MNDPVLSCPDCRARVFPNWARCKFCGAVLQDGEIGAAVDPDDLVGPRSDPPAVGPTGDPATPGWDPSPDPTVGSPPQSPAAWPADRHDPWSAEPTSDPGTPSGSLPTSEPPDWFDPPGDPQGSAPITGEGADGSGEPGGGSLVPVEAAGDTWAPGPAPALDDGPGNLDEDEEVWGTVGLEPVAWYPEPTGPPSATPPEPDPSGTGPPRDDPPPGPEGERFDPTAIFRDPPPAGPWGAGVDLEPVGEPGELDVRWEPAAADAWDTPVEPRGRPKGQPVLSREARMLMMGIILILVVVAGMRWAQDRDAGHPSEWAPNVQGVADWVSETRDLPFAHKIAVDSLAPAEYDALVEAAARPESESARQALTDDVAKWRALAGLQGNPEARMGWVEVQRPDLGAFYDLDRGRLNLRSGAPVDQMEIGLAGALSVALDDQHGDLSALEPQGIAENPVLEVVAGTAALIRKDFADSRSDGDDRAIDELQQLPSFEGSDRDLEFLHARTLLQTGLGDGFVQFVRAAEGLDAANMLVAAPPGTSQQVMFPLTYLSGRGPLGLDPPSVPDDAELLETGTLGASAWYLLLAGHLGPQTDLGEAFEFARRWAGDEFVAYRRGDGQVCVADVLRGADDSDLRAITATLRTWSESVPDERITVESSGELQVTVTGCDPGADADPSLDGSYGDAVLTAIVRAHLAAGYYVAGVAVDNGPNPPIFTPETAWCMAEHAADRSSSLKLWQLVRHNGEDYERTTLAAGEACGSHQVDQLFTPPDR